MESDATAARAKITYATMSADQMSDLHRDLDAAIERVKAEFGRSHPMFIDGRAVNGPAESDDTSPIDTRILLGRFQDATRDQMKEAIAAARAAFATWSRVPWEERVRIVRAVGGVIRERRSELAALVGYEVGKSRLECVGEIEEAADFFDYYCDRMEATDGFTNLMGMPGAPEESRSVLRPYGVFGIIAPFNFPVALAAGPAAAALLAGNTVVFKPAEDTPFSSLKFYEIVAGLVPAGVVNMVTGPGVPVGQELADNPGVDGLVFTGSMEVGMKLIRDNGARPVPRPLIIEMGGKNPALVMPSADLDRASDGVMRSAFGATGQKCSACSRVYVSREARARFVEQLVAKAKQIRVGNPLERDVWMGPVINARAVKRYEDAVAEAKRDGGRVLTGGRRITEEPFNHGYFVEPTVIEGLPSGHRLFRDELFVPITVVGEVLTLDEAIDLANRTRFGLTAGIFSEDEREIGEFFDRVQAGVVYANRRAGATTGAWPGQNSFGGWKASGSTGKGTGGPHYLQQFFREQSRTRVR
jgi:1-pyrroline-5-carboxylate dehydrogenase